ncbi:MAG: sugar transferase [Chloroflexi bacterium]|nr:sugar transferase [Chloroflexota bacterium]
MKAIDRNMAALKKRRGRFSLQFAERKLLLLLVDLAILNGALFLMLSLASEPAFTRMLERFPRYALLLSAIWLVVDTFFNVYDLAKTASAVHSILAAGVAVLVTLTVYTLLPYVIPVVPSRRIQILVFVLTGLLGITFWRSFYALVFSLPSFRHRALVIGANWSGRTLVDAIQKSASEGDKPYLGTGYELLGFIDDDPARQGSAIGGVPVLGSGQDLVRLAKTLRPDEIIIAITHVQRINPDLFRAILVCYEMGISLTTMATLYEQMTGRVPVQHAGQDLSVLLPISRPSGFRLYLAMRRLLDILISIPGMFMVLAVTPFVWLGNLLSGHPRNLFYCQARVGQGGRSYGMFKFRSMRMNAETDTGAVWAQENDPRVTLVGRLLRRTRLDELPQFWNVLKGDMTLVGPRPERPEIVAELAEEIPFYGLRHVVKPGITGWAQVRYRYGASVEDSFIKLQYDLYYIKHQGPFIDLEVILKTVRVVLGLHFSFPAA